MVAAGEASTGRQVLHKVQEDDYDVLLLDISMPDGSGLEVLHELRTLRPELRILILSMYPERQYAVRALKAGAAGYLTKESAPDELVVAVRRVAKGGRYITQSLAEELAAGLVGEMAEVPAESLSDREYQVMRLLATGKTISEIADELALSAKTVSTYRARILDKLNLRNTAEIIRYAFEQGLV
jgi:two-component system invasion response regulator UvrY